MILYGACGNAVPPLPEDRELSPQNLLAGQLLQPQLPRPELLLKPQLLLPELPRPELRLQPHRGSRASTVQPIQGPRLRPEVLL